SDGLCDSAIAIPEPLPGEDAPWADLLLRDLRACAFVCRESWEQAEEALSSIRELLRTRPRETEPIHMQVNRLYQSARFHHLLLEYWKHRSNEIEDLPAEDQEQKRDELEGWLNQRSNATSGYSYSAHETLFDQAKTDYRSAMQI